MAEVAPSQNLSMLKTAALAAAAAAVVQGLLGGYLITADDGPFGLHNVIGLVCIVLAALAAFAAMRWRSEGGNPGLFFHAAGMAGIALVQYALGEVGARAIHIMLGMLFVLGSIALATLANRKPFA